jgi:hypothetical protein
MSVTRTTDEAGLECCKTTKGGIVTSEHYYWGYMLHRPHEAGPAWIERNDAGIALEAYFWEDKLHRPHEAGPALIERNNVGLATCEAYYWKGKRHRPPDAGPARMKRNDAGMVTYEAYYWEDKWHRPPEDGPARIKRNDAGMVTWEGYYWEGKPLNGAELRWARRKKLLRFLLRTWVQNGGKPGRTRKGLRRLLALRRVCRFHPDASLKHRLVEPFGQAVVAFL